MRGPQSALFGRNTLGGLVNVSSARPSLTKWTGSAVVPFGNFGAVDVRANASGPIGKQGGGRLRDRPLAARRLHDERRHRPRPRLPRRHVRQGAAAADARRQLGSAPHLHRRARARRRLRAERSRRRCAPIRSTRRATSRGTPTATSTRRRSWRATPGQKLTFSSTTGFVRWKTDDLTDLDYSPLPLLTRSNDEKDSQFTQEVRFASAPAGARQALGRGVAQVAGRALPVHAELRPGRGQQLRAVRALAVHSVPGAASTRPQAALDDTGVGVYGNGTVAFNDRVDLTSARAFDHENRKADLQHVLRRAGDRRAAGDRQHREVVLERVAAGGGRLPRAARRDGLRLGDRRLQGRRLQPGVAGGQRGLRRRAHLELSKAA